MSEPIPESIPTSHDPRSKRPTKRRALTPTSQQATQLSALFAKPDREIPLPSSSLTKSHPHVSAPPEIVANVQGSSAGAGSGEFHVYKASRRREYERLRVMDEEVKREKEEEEFRRKGEELRKKDEAKTSKNKARREKLKAKKAGKSGEGKDGEGKDGEGKDGGKGGEAGSGGSGGRDGGQGVDATGGAPSMEGVVKNAEEIWVIIHDDD